MIFNPCNGQCTKEGTHCEGCGRNHKEIFEMKQLVNDAVEFATKMEYENPEDYAKSFGNSIQYVITQNQESVQNK